MTQAPTKRDYISQPVSVQLGLEAVITGLAGDLTELRGGKISPNDALARAAVAKQLFNGVRLYLQAMKTLEAQADPEALRARQPQSEGGR